MFGLCCAAATLGKSAAAAQHLESLLQANAVKVCKRQLKPRHSAQLAADIVEHAINTEAENYLQTHAHALSWWQHSLDVKAFLAVIVIAAVGLSAGLVVFICKTIVSFGMVMSHSRSGSKQKIN